VLIHEQTTAVSGCRQLDGFIAGPNGEYDWIVMDPSIDFNALYKEFDTAVMRRKTYEVTAAQGDHGAMPGLSYSVAGATATGYQTQGGITVRETRLVGGM
jgi:hypothetical protein